MKPRFCPEWWSSTSAPLALTDRKRWGGEHPQRGAPTRRWAVRLASLMALGAAGVLAGCAQSPAEPGPVPSASYTPYTAVPPRAIDLRSASQALALQISARGVSVDGLNCRASGRDPASLRLRCTVVTGGGADHPDQIAEATWNKSAGTVQLGTVAAAPVAQAKPLATASIASVADGADVPGALITRSIRPALVLAGALSATASLTCDNLHAGVAGCEVRDGSEPIQYLNVVLAASTLRIYRARG